MAEGPLGRSWRSQTKWTFEVNWNFPQTSNWAFLGKVTETMRRDYERCLLISQFFSLLRNVSYFNLSSLNFFRWRKQTIYCNDSVLQINSSILWVIKTVNPFHTAFQLHSIQWITSLAMLCYTNFLPNSNVNTMAGVISDSSPRNTAVL